MFSIVSYPHDVRDVYLSSSGVLSGMDSGGVIVDMTTSSPGLAAEIYEKLDRKESNPLMRRSLEEILERNRVRFRLWSAAAGIRLTVSCPFLS